MPDSIWTAFALLLILEGLLPFVAPRVWREAFRKMLELSDGQLRFVGLTAIGFGTIALLIIQYA